MTQKQANNRWFMWMLITAMLLLNGFRDEISSGWTNTSSVVFIVAACGIFIHQILADSSNRQPDE